MKTRPVRNRKVQFAFGSAILALLVVGTISYRAIIVTSESDRWVQHTYEVLGNLNKLLAAMETIQASYRGFALTGDEANFLAYHENIENAAQAEKAVRDLTVDNSVQQVRLPALERLIAEKIQFADDVIGLRRTSGLAAAGDAIRTGWGQEIMDEIENTVHEMEDEELRLLVLRNADAKHRLEQTKTVLILGTLLGILIAVGAGWIAQRDHAARQRAEAARREGEERFSSLANNISQLAWMADEKGSIFWYNQRWFDYFGCTLDDMATPGWEKGVHHPDHLQRVLDKITQCFQTGEIWEDTFPLRGRDGNYHMFLSRAVPIRDSAGKVLRWFGTNTDISEHQAMEDALFAEKERAQVTLNSIGDAVICTDLAGNISYLNAVAEEMTGWSGQDAAGRPMADVFRILDATTREIIPNPMELAVVQNRTMNLPSNCHLIHRDGSETPIEDSVSPIHDRQGRSTGAVIVFRDVSEARAMTEQMTYSAQHDFLTGLPNRMLLNDRVSQAIAVAPRHNRKVAVLFLDLDRFKHINDSLGHSIGDKLLQSVAKRLVDCVRSSDTVSRQGGDEFVVLLSEVEQAQDAEITARRVLETIAASHSVDDHDLHVTVSIGISIYPGDGLDGETLIKNADTAMYHAKENGRQSYQFFEQAMNTRAVARQSIEESLRRALERQEIALYYQPKVNLRTGEITGAEALIRWNHPTRGIISPAEFIPVAEDCGLILPIGSWVLREACQQARIWLDAGLPLNTVAVNISAMEFRDSHFLERVFTILDQTGLDPRFLELELTEGLLMKSAESTESILKTLRARGVQVAIDDFGTGYSSLSYLTKFPIDALKIDQSFVHRITTAPDDTTIVTAIISMARSLNMRVVAEGVETQDEMTFLRAHKCDEAQGYYFSRPVVAPQFAILLQTGISKVVST
jgi:diguanylate cyclase (GGDEF)-like protein/PAS domain S-box-containing protein